MTRLVAFSRDGSSGLIWPFLHLGEQLMRRCGIKDARVPRASLTQTIGYNLPGVAPLMLCEADEE